MAAAVIGFGVVAATVLVGTTGQALALTLIGLGLVLVTCLIFLEVGLSEDRDRAKEKQAASLKRFTRQSSRHHPDRQSPGKLARSRGRRRRLR